MPVEFSCRHCGALVHIGDDATGKLAECRACGMFQPPPGGASDAPRPAPADPPPLASSAADLESESESGDVPRPADSGDNPYASPASAVPPPADRAEPSDARTGPAWEREGATLATLFATAQELLFSPSAFFSQMRREGSSGRPLNFAISGALVGVGLWSASWFAFTLISLTLQHKLPVGRMATAGPRELGEMQGMMICDACFAFVLLAFAVAIQTACLSLLLHLTLLFLGAANYSFQTTFRVVAYAVGAAMLSSAVPLCGLYFAFPMQLVYIGIGLKKVQEIETATAVAAMFLPTILCGGGILTLVFASGT